MPLCRKGKRKREASPPPAPDPPPPPPEPEPQGPTVEINAERLTGGLVAMIRGGAVPW